MVDRENPRTLADKIRRKISELTPTAVQEQLDEIKAKAPTMKCPACNTQYPNTLSSTCPKDGKALLPPDRARWTWYEYAKHGDQTIQRCPKCEGIFRRSERHCKDDKVELESIELSSIKRPILEERFQLLSYLSSDKIFDCYRARDLKDDNNIVSINFLTAAMSADPKTVSNFLKLGQSIIGLTHPNILSIYSVNVTPDGPQNGLRGEGYAVPYSVSDYVIARSLEAEIRDRHWFDPDSAAKIFIDILSGLGHAHERGITHGAISTNNLRVAGGVGSRGKGLISNFGVAERLFREMDWDGPSTETRTANVYGDPDGMCPEFCAGQRPTAMTDQYQIGCALYEALSGRPPFERPGLTQVLMAHASDEPDDIAAKNREIPTELIKVVLKCLQKDPVNRYPSVQALADALRQFTKP